MKKTKIVCTIGPASESLEVLEQLVLSGMNAARLNFSHGDHEEHGKRIKAIKDIREKLKKPISIMLDTKGPEIRTGNFRDGKAEVKEGQNFTFTTNDVTGDSTICSISYKDLPKDIKIGDIILVDDGLIGFKVLSINGTEISCTVLNSGTIGNHKGVNVPGAPINIPALTQKDIDDIVFGVKNGVDIIAASFVRKSGDVISINRLLEENGAGDILVVSKIESQEGVNNIDDILKFSDGIMVARGDLGVEIPVEDVPLVQKMIIDKCNKAGKPVITATQMLDSMMRNPRPTRAEVTDVANAIFDGTDCIMLSGETASGAYPVESVKTMARIAERTEMSLDYDALLEKRKPKSARTIPDAICFSACTTAAELMVSAIITATMTGYSAKMVSKFRPRQPIIAVTPSDNVARRLSIVWGVYPFLMSNPDSTDDIMDISVEKALESGIVKKGELVVIAAGLPTGFTGTTNMIKVQIVGDVLVKGKGAGIKSAYGNAVVIKDIKDAAEFINEGDIIIISKLENEYADYLDKISGIVAEENGLTSYTAVECINRGIPIISGAEGAMDIIKSGSLITLDITRGLVFSGKANVV